MSDPTPSRSYGIPPNPFSTRFVAPGKLPFRFADEPQKILLLQRCERHNYVGQIVGPHGSGKTTLTFAMESWLPTSFVRTVRLTIDSKSGWFPLAHVRNAVSRPRAGNCDLTSPSELGTGGRTMFFIDGCERLPWLHWLLLRSSLQRMGHGLIVTTHRPCTGIPVFMKTSHADASLKDITRPIIQQFTDDELMLSRIANTIHMVETNDLLDQQGSDDGRRVGHRNAGNRRELLMRCYDIFESQTSESQSSESHSSESQHAGL